VRRTIGSIAVIGVSHSFGVVGAFGRVTRGG
jgi:hypothetical protein